VFDAFKKIGKTSGNNS
jgi:DNA ligase 1